MKTIKQTKLLSISFFAVTFFSFIIVAFVDNDITSTIGILLLLKSFVAGIVFLIQFIKKQRKSVAVINNEDIDKKIDDLKFYQQPNFIVCMLIFVPIIGIILMWTQGKGKKTICAILTLVFLFACLFDIVSLTTINDTGNSPTESISQFETTIKTESTTKTITERSTTEESTTKKTTTESTTKETTTEKATESTTKNTTTAAAAKKTTTTEKATAAPTTTKQATTTKKQTTTQNSPKGDGRTVYNTPTGECYHFDPDCGGKNSKAISLDDAKSRGLRPCKKCAN